MKQKRSTFLQKNKSSVERLNMNNTIYNVFWLLTLTASHTPDRAFFFPIFYRITYIAQQEWIHITPDCFYQTIDELIDMNIIKPTKFKYHHRLNPIFFSFPK